MDICLIKNRGATLIEFTVAMFVFVAIIATVSGLFYGTRIASQQAEEYTKAIFLSREGLEAVRSIRSDNFDALTVGTHGISISEGNWVLDGSHDMNGKFKREIIITETETGLKLAKSEVTWNITPARELSFSLVEYFSLWEEVNYNLVVSSGDFGSVTDPGEGSYFYNVGQIVDLLAVADEEYTFESWTGDVSNIDDVYSASTTIQMDEDANIVANFISLGGPIMPL
jgi:hypothetical protein